MIKITPEAVGIIVITKGSKRLKKKGRKILCLIL